jgi:hypothetical protein
MVVNRRPKSLVWPLILISIGILFLLKNLGVVDWNLWSLLWRTWPVIIIAVGLDLIFGRRSGIWSVITAGVVIVLFAGALWIFDVSDNNRSGDLITKSVVQEIGDAEEAEIDINMNIGILKIGALEAESDLLISGEVEISDFEELSDDLEVSGDTLKYTLSSDGKPYQAVWIPNQEVDNDKTWDLRLNRELMLDLAIDTGVGKFEIDLSELRISKLDLNTGVGEVTIELPSEGNFRADVSGGVGKLTLYLPSDLAAGLFIDGGLGNVSVSGDFTQRNGNYFTQNYESSSDQIQLYIDGGIGAIWIEQID